MRQTLIYNQNLVLCNIIFGALFLILLLSILISLYKYIFKHFLLLPIQDKVLLLFYYYYYYHCCSSISTFLLFFLTLFLCKKFETRSITFDFMSISIISWLFLCSNFFFSLSRLHCFKIKLNINSYFIMTSIDDDNSSSFSCFVFFSMLSAAIIFAIFSFHIRCVLENVDDAIELGFHYIGSNWQLHDSM